MTDWDKAYDNRGAVKDTADYLDRWKQEAEQFRASIESRNKARTDIEYGSGERNRYDLFEPDYDSKGVVVFIHGGYWRALDKSWFSHLAAGPLSHGWKVAIPSYTLAPQARINEITQEIANVIITVAGSNEGPIRLVGHSAGGHLVSRMLCNDKLLPDDVYARIANTVAVSGLFDLQHLPKTKMNDDLRLDEAEVKSESPINHAPREGTRITCLVGGSELPEFLRQNELLEGWKEQGAKVKMIADQGKHHFSVIEPLANPSSLMTMALLT